MPFGIVYHFLLPKLTGYFGINDAFAGIMATFLSTVLFLTIIIIIYIVTRQRKLRHQLNIRDVHPSIWKFRCFFGHSMTLLRLKPEEVYNALQKIKKARSEGSS